MAYLRLLVIVCHVCGGVGVVFLVHVVHVVGMVVVVWGNSALCDGGGGVVVGRCSRLCVSGDGGGCWLVYVGFCQGAT